MNETADTSSEFSNKNPSRISLRALDGLNFFLADVRDGMGPFLGTFLRDSQHWDAGKVGIALAAAQLGTVLAQTPAGGLIDRTHRKRLAIAIAAGFVACGCLMLYWMPYTATVFASQMAIGAASSIFPPAIAALTLGVVGRRAMARRTGRNEAFNHAGNVVAAALAGSCAYFLGYGSMFFLVAGMAAASIVAVFLIREADIDHNLARGSDEPGVSGSEPISLNQLFSNRQILIFIVSAVLFHLANAAMLPLVGQKASDQFKEGAPLLMSACIIAAQVVMVPVALLASRLAVTWGRRPVFLVGFAVLPVRGLLYCLSVNPYFLVGVQLLDGVGAGIFGVVTVLIVADLTQSTGRFNFTQGVLATATGVGAGLSNLLAGLVVKAAGFNAGFLMLTALACVGLCFYACFMAETRDEPRENPIDGIGVAR